MGINHRKLLQIPQSNSHFQNFQANGHDVNDCYYFSYQDSLPLPLPAPPPPRYSYVDNSKTNLPILPIFALLFFFLAGFLVLICFLALVRKYHLNLNNIRGRNSPDLDQNEDFINENRGPEFVHPIWFINSVGLQQSVIDSIAIFKYKRDDALTEGTECSVCLGEFEEDESLRLLPNCSHAFHTPCIDTWLRSHKNCPMCRAPVVLDTTHRNLNGLSLREENSVENNNNGEFGSQYRGETGEIRTGGENTSALALPNEQGNINDKKTSPCANPGICDGQVLSDMAELQPVRRSISMEHEASSKKLDTKKVARQQGNKSNSRKYGVLMKSSSFGRSAHKGSGSIKRSLSTSGQCSRPRSSRTHDSILPL